MTKFIITNSSVLTINGQAITCATEISFDETADTYFSQCGAAGGTGVKEPVVGTKQVTGSITSELNIDDVSKLTYLAPGYSGALVCQPAGNTGGNIAITATTLKITGRQTRYSTNGLATVVSPFVMDSIAIAAI